MRLFQRLEPRPASVVELRGGREVDVVGESHYQVVLSRICGGKTRDGHHHGCIAALVAEPHNKYDPNAVSVRVDGMTVGYLSRETAPAYGPVLERIARRGLLATCDAEIRGGWDRGRGDEGHFGIFLLLAEPAYCHPDDPPAPTVPPPR